MTSMNEIPLAESSVSMMEGMATTRAIRRYLPESVPDQVLRDIMFAATRAPSGSNRQPFRFMVFTDSEKSKEVKNLIARGAQTLWQNKKQTDGYDTTLSTDETSPKARMARTMQNYVDHFADVPVLILAMLVRYRPPTPTEGASVYPSCQNILLAARALGYGGVLTGFHGFVEDELRTMVKIPDEVFIAATITLGKPAGNHGPVRRVPLNDVVFADEWGVGAPWAIDPPGTSTLSRGGFS